MSGSSLRLETLPFELLCRISMFLLPEHATKLRETCTQMRRLRISLLNPTLKVLPWAHRWTGHVISGDEPRVAFRLPLARRRLHSVRVSFLWHDQGRGNQKGEAWLVSIPMGTPTPRTIVETNVISSYGIAPHARARVSSQFVPVKDQEYFIWYKAGSGGGHALIMEDIQIHLTIFDDIHGNFALLHTALHAARALTDKFDSSTLSIDGTFYLDMFLQVTTTLESQLERNEQVNLHFSSFLTRHGIPVGSAALRALREILQGRLEQVDEANFPVGHSEQDDIIGNTNNHFMIRVEGGDVEVDQWQGFFIGDVQ